MSLPVFTNVKVVAKWVKDGENSKKYYNLKVVDTASYDSQIISVPEEVYNSVTEDEDVKLVGKVGGVGNNKYYYFNALDVGK